MRARLLAMIAIAAFIVQAGEFKTKLNKSESVTLTIPHPADTVIHAKVLALKWQTGQAAFKREVELTQLLQQALAKEFEFSNTPDATLQYSVIAYEPVTISTITKMENRTINTGTDQKPNYQERSVQAVDRLNLAKADAENARKLKVEQEAAARVAMQKAVENAREKQMLEAAVADKSPDTPDEANFRADVRTRLTAINGEVNDTQKAELLAFGKRLHMPELKAYRIVVQEVDRKQNLAQALKDYEDTFKPLVADGKITARERAQLRDLARREDLDKNDVASVESKYKFVDETQPASRAPKSRAPVNSSLTPVVSQRP
ncbi:MAG: hypothetical protein M3Y72_21925 [Acidobacteriota bacterium]|nr:hypothetical protein [Acidobacteriota bacterium]